MARQKAGRGAKMLKRKWALVAAAMGALGSTTAAQAEWREVETAHFRIYSEGKEKDVVQYAERLEAVHYLMKIATGMKDDKPVNKVDVYYVYSVEELRRVLDAKPNSSVAGIYIPSIRGSAAIVPRNNGGSDLDPQSVLFHEYAHHFMLQYQPGAYPPWYVEGWAELISTASFERKGTITFGKAASHRQGELEYLRWIPLRNLMGRSKEDRDVINRDYGSYYGQSWLLTHYLTLSDKRPGQLRAYVLAVLRGQSDEEAWKAFGDIDELEREVRAYLRAANFPYKAPPLPPEVMAIQSSRALRPGEAAIMDERIESLHQTMDEEERADIVARTEAEAARFPDDAAVQLFLAEQCADAEKWTKSAVAAERAVALDATLARAHLAQGLALSHGEAADEEKARAALDQALALAPTDPSVLYGQFEGAARLGNASGGATVDQLIRASDLAPQNDGIRLAASEALIRKGDLGGALRRLMPLASDPHPSGAQRRAQQLVAWLAGGGSGTPPAPGAGSDEKGGDDESGGS
jgi:hypothetical protein